MDISKKVASQLLGTIFFVLALCTATPATAESDERVRLYLGAGGGFTNLKNAEDVFNTGGVSASTQDRNDTGVKAFLGIEFVPHGAMEISVFDFGKFSASDAASPLYNENFEALGANIGFVGGGDINSFISAHVKLGLFAWRVKSEGTDAAGTGFSNKETGADFSWGFGTQFNFGRFVAMRIELEQFMNAGEDLVTGRSDLQFISASVLFRL